MLLSLVDPDVCVDEIIYWFSNKCFILIPHISHPKNDFKHDKVICILFISIQYSMPRLPKTLHTWYRCLYTWAQLSHLQTMFWNGSLRELLFCAISYPHTYPGAPRMIDDFCVWITPDTNADEVFQLYISYILKSNFLVNQYVVWGVGCFKSRSKGNSLLLLFRGFARIV